jgi:hypothetical protein
MGILGAVVFATNCPLKPFSPPHALTLAHLHYTTVHSLEYRVCSLTLIIVHSLSLAHRVQLPSLPIAS